MAGKLNILAISGSLREQSYNTRLLHVLKDMASGAMDMEIVRLKGIPVYDGDDEAASGIPQIVQDLATRIRAADGVLISTPEYNFSIPGGLKNATDWHRGRGSKPGRHRAVPVPLAPEPRRPGGIDHEQAGTVRQPGPEQVRCRRQSHR